MNTSEILSLQKGDIITGVHWTPDGSEWEVGGIEKSFGSLSILIAGHFPFSSGDLSDATIVSRYKEPKKLSLIEKMQGCTFKFGLIKNTRGTINDCLIENFKDSEYIFQSFSGKFVYGYPVGHYGDRNYRFQFDATQVMFYMDGQDSEDSVPNVSLLKKIKMTAD